MDKVGFGWLLAPLFNQSHARCPPSHTTHTTELQGDKELQISPWQEVNQGVGATRSVRFVAPLEVRPYRRRHSEPPPLPLSVLHTPPPCPCPCPCPSPCPPNEQGLPVGPPTAPVLQQQRVRVFGQHGMIWEASSTMENVPAADCFTLEDRWVIAPSNREAPGEGGLRIHTTFEVRFVKSTFFRKIIEGRSSKDTLHYHKTCVRMRGGVDTSRRSHGAVPTDDGRHARTHTHDTQVLRDDGEARNAQAPGGRGRLPADGAGPHPTALAALGEGADGESEWRRQGGGRQRAAGPYARGHEEKCVRLLCALEAAPGPCCCTDHTHLDPIPMIDASLRPPSTPAHPHTLQ